MITRTGDRLREIMRTSGVDQYALAAAVGVTQGTISSILVGKTRRSRFLPDIAAHFGVSLAWLRGEDVSPNSDILHVGSQPSQPRLILMSVALPSEDALTKMFEAHLNALRQLKGSDLARALARRLPEALAQIQGSAANI